MEWINVNDRLPKKAGKYLICEHNEWGEGLFTGTEWKSTDRPITNILGGRFRADLKPTHWLDVELPKLDRI